jgi:hypothetical protein
MKQFNGTNISFNEESRLAADTLPFCLFARRSHRRAAECAWLFLIAAALDRARSNAR